MKAHFRTLALEVSKVASTRRTQNVCEHGEERRKKKQKWSPELGTSSALECDKCLVSCAVCCCVFISRRVARLLLLLVVGLLTNMNDDFERVYKAEFEKYFHFFFGGSRPLRFQLLHSLRWCWYDDAIFSRIFFQQKDLDYYDLHIAEWKNREFFFAIYSSHLSKNEAKYFHGLFVETKMIVLNLNWSSCEVHESTVEWENVAFKKFLCCCRHLIIFFLIFSLFPIPPSFVCLFFSAVILYSYQIRRQQHKSRDF